MEPDSEKTNGKIKSGLGRMDGIVENIGYVMTMTSNLVREMRGM